MSSKTRRQDKTITQARNWAMRVRVLDKLLPGDRWSSNFNDPQTLVQRVTKNCILCGGPKELFSSHMPTLILKKAEDEILRPIDVLYGNYDPLEESIRIFVRRIQGDARLYSCHPSVLIQLVRIHEYAHAFVHLAIDSGDIERQLSEWGSAEETDWDSFRIERSTVFSSLDEECHELLAQAITWTCLETIKSEVLTKAFIALEARQPVHYRLPTLVKDRVLFAEWPFILKRVREGISSQGRATFSMFEGLTALIESYYR